MKAIVAILSFSFLAIGAAGCASVTTVLNNDAPFDEKLKNLGGIVKEFLEGPHGTREEAIKKYGYKGSGVFMEIEDTSLVPNSASPGQTIQATVTYVLLSPAPPEKVKIIESRTLVGPVDSLLLSQRDVVRDQGSQSSSIKFTLPVDIAKGEYTLITSISDGSQTKVARSTLQVV